jgi:hypothetical protein
MFDDFQITLLLGWVTVMFVLCVGPFVSDAVSSRRKSRKSN